MNELRFILPGSIRSKKNHRRPIIVGGKNCKRRIANIPSKTYAEWEENVRASIMLGFRSTRVTLLSGPVSVEAHVYYKGPRPDLSGCLESIGDCLEGFVWLNDGQIESWDGSRLHHSIDNPRTEVIVRWEENKKSSPL